MSIEPKLQQLDVPHLRRHWQSAAVS